MTRSELLQLVESTFGEYGIKTVSSTDINKSAYVPNMAQKRIFETLGIDPLDRRDDIEIKELFTNRVFTMSYYATLREGSGRSPEQRMGLTDLISYLSIGDEILFTKDNENIFIYNLSYLSDLSENNDRNEERVYSQVSIELLKDRASNIDTRPEKEERTVNVYPRNNSLRTYIKKRSSYSCEMPNCNYVGFEKSDGEKYVEVHHVQSLSEGGEDRIENAVSLCPTCHRKIHFADNKEELKVSLLEYLEGLE